VAPGVHLSLRWSSVAVLAALQVFPATAAERQAVDLELVLAVDVSSSVDDEEYLLQMHGLAFAFRHPDVVSAIRSSTIGGIAVAVVHWSDADMQKLAVDWTPVWDRASAADLADTIFAVPRLIAGGPTSISGAIEFSLRQIESNGYDGARLTIDVSGDGRANSGPQPMDARDRATAAGITINGLAILNEEPFVDRYYRHSVIGGREAFLIPASDYDAFAAAIVEKLIREIGVPLTERRVPGARMASLTSQR
jgi:hypothetical protein